MYHFYFNNFNFKYEFVQMFSCAFGERGILAENEQLMYILQIIFIDFRQRCDLNCAVALAKWIIHALNLEERVVNVVNSVLSVPIEDWTELASVLKI